MKVWRRAERGIGRQNSSGRGVVSRGEAEEGDQEGGRPAWGVAIEDNGVVVGGEWGCMAGEVVAVWVGGRVERVGRVAWRGKWGGRQGKGGLGAGALVAGESLA